MRFTDKEPPVHETAVANGREDSCARISNASDYRFVPRWTRPGHGSRYDLGASGAAQANSGDRRAALEAGAKAGAVHGLFRTSGRAR